MAAGFLDRDRGYRRFARGMLRPGRHVLKVGVQGTEAQQDHGGVTNVTIMAINEFGKPDNTLYGRPAPIPERPVLRGTFDAKHQDWLRLGVALMRRRAAEPQSVNLERLGAKMVADLKNAMAEGVGDPPSPTTLALRARRGQTGDKQLIVTGQLKNSITYVVEGGS